MLYLLILRDLLDLNRLIHRPRIGHISGINFQVYGLRAILMGLRLNGVLMIALSGGHLLAVLVHMLRGAWMRLVDEHFDLVEEQHCVEEAPPRRDH